MKRFQIFLFILFSFAVLLAQEDICIGKKYKLYSDLLHEVREYQVYLPPSYIVSPEEEKLYPVIYLLDGESFFQTLIAVHRSCTGGRQSLMPEHIIVGIINTERTRDLTPTKSAYRRDGTKQKGDEEIGGGSELFFRFLTEELQSKIEKEYRTNGDKMLIGHSFGGLFVINALLKHTEKFNTYIALDPSLWWDNQRLAGEAENILKVKQFQNKILYIGVARQIRPDRQYIHLSVMDSFLEEKLPEVNENGLTYYSKQFMDENHGSIPLPGMIDAFKQIYIQKN